jgi:hypothetical protein
MAFSRTSGAKGKRPNRPTRPILKAFWPLELAPPLAFGFLRCSRQSRACAIATTKPTSTRWSWCSSGESVSSCHDEGRKEGQTRIGGYLSDQKQKVGGRADCPLLAMNGRPGAGESQAKSLAFYTTMIGLIFRLRASQFAAASAATRLFGTRIWTSYRLDRTSVRWQAIVRG